MEEARKIAFGGSERRKVYWYLYYSCTNLTTIIGSFLGWNIV